MTDNSRYIGELHAEIASLTARCEAMEEALDIARNYYKTIDESKAMLRANIKAVCDCISAKINAALRNSIKQLRQDMPDDPYIKRLAESVEKELGEK